MLWALVADLVPLYPLYALLFADTGLSDGQISLLFAIWSVVGIVVEVPTGALADRFSRRSALVAAGVLQSLGYALWIGLPGFSAFAAGFVLWGIGGSLVSGALEALLYDGLRAAGAADRFADVLGRVTAAGLIAQLPAAAAASALFALGGFRLAGWVSVGGCLLAAVLAARIPEAPRAPTVAEEDDPGYLGMLRAGLREAAARPLVRRALLAVAVLTAIDAFEEYTPLIARDWGVPTGVTPVAVLGISLAGAAGAALGGRASRLRATSFTAVLALAAGALGAAGVLRQPAGLLAVAGFYGLYRLVLVVVSTRLQERIDGDARATVTSVAGIGTDVLCLGFYALWAAGGVRLVAVLVLLVALGMPWLLGGRARPAPAERPAATGVSGG